MAYVESRGHRISYQAAGEGPAVVLVCGIVQWAGQWRDAGYVDALRDSFQVITLDPLGHGASDKPADPAEYRTVEAVADAIAVLDDIGREEAIWWGYSRGGSLVLDLAHHHPDRVRALVLGDTVRLFRGETSHPHAAPVFESEEGLAALWSGSGNADPDSLAEMLAVNDVSALRAAFHGADSDPCDFDEVDVPVLAYRSSGEITDEWMVSFLERVGAERHALEDATHSSAFTRSADVLAFVRPFLERHGLSQFE